MKLLHWADSPGPMFHTIRCLETTTSRYRNTSRHLVQASMQEAVQKQADRHTDRHCLLHHCGCSRPRLHAAAQVWRRRSCKAEMQMLLDHPCHYKHRPRVTRSAMPVVACCFSCNHCHCHKAPRTSKMSLGRHGCAWYVSATHCMRHCIIYTLPHCILSTGV